MRLRTLVAALALVALAAPAFADGTTAAPPPAALKADYLAAFDDAAKKVRALAEAIPEEKYSWRPAAGIRSVGEVFAHVIGGNYLLTEMAGVAKPADAPKDPETISSKKDLLDGLDRSAAHVRAAIEAATPEAMAKEVDFFGQKKTARGLYLIAYGHVSEHLGQAIAYARSIGVKPPWSS
jgi:uncharacterized damage-inducible protein DinB